MLANYKILTVTHKKSNLKNIGDFVIKASDEGELKGRLTAIKKQFNIDELFYLPTCNRVMYFFTSSQPLDAHFASHFFQSVNVHLPIEALNHIEDHAFLYEGEEALEHFLDVAASIDSLVIGERQILRQLREAFDQCHAWGLAGEYLRLAYQQAVAAAKAVYSKTRIGDKPVSVVSLAIQRMMKSHLAKDARILLVGAGQTNQLVAKFIAKHHFSSITVFNRSFDKAAQLAEQLEGRALPLSALTDYKEGFDCMIVCTGATEPIITPELYHTLANGEGGRKVVIDLAIPHNVAPEVVDNNELHYIEIEGLRHLAKSNLAFREQEVHRAKDLLGEYLAAFPSLLRQRQIELAMRAVPTEIKQVKNRAMNEVFRKEVETLDGPTRELVERMLSYMEKKCIGIPMKAAREAVLANDSSPLNS